MNLITPAKIHKKNEKIKSLVIKMAREVDSEDFAF